jgi:hypothetical protein
MQDPSAHPQPGLNGVPPSPSRPQEAVPSHDAKAERLPPPMFPPGSSFRARRREPEPAEDESYHVPDDAFIMPDEPFRRRGSRDEREARAPEEAPARDRRMNDPFRGERGVASGIGESAPDADDERQITAVSGGDPHVAELIRLVRRLSDSLVRKGEAGLRATSDMTRFEATLRAYCVGFLAAARAVDRSRPQA